MSRNNVDLSSVTFVECIIHMLGGARASSSTMSVQSFSVCTVSGLEDEEREGCAVEWDGSGGGGGGGWDAD